MEKNILIAMDDSDNALRAVTFIGNNFNKDENVTLFHVELDTSAICEMNSPELVPHFLAQKGAFCNLEEQKKQLVEVAMLKAKDILVGSGFDEKRIIIKVESAKKNVARGIIDEANSGYKTIVMGRKGHSSIKEFFLGSVTQKVIHSVHSVSILLVE